MKKPIEPFLQASDPTPVYATHEVSNQAAPAAGFNRCTCTARCRSRWRYRASSSEPRSSGIEPPASADADGLAAKIESPIAQTVQPPHCRNGDKCVRYTLRTGADLIRDMQSESSCHNQKSPSGSRWSAPSASVQASLSL